MKASVVCVQWGLDLKQGGNFENQGSMPLFNRASLGCFGNHTTWKYGSSSQFECYLLTSKNLH